MGGGPAGNAEGHVGAAVAAQLVEQRVQRSAGGRVQPRQPLRPPRRLRSTARIQALLPCTRTRTHTRSILWFLDSHLFMHCNGAYLHCACMHLLVHFSTLLAAGLGGSWSSLHCGRSWAYRVLPAQGQDLHEAQSTALHRRHCRTGRYRRPSTSQQ